MVIQMEAQIHHKYEPRIIILEGKERFALLESRCTLKVPVLLLECYLFFLGSLAPTETSHGILKCDYLWPWGLSLES